MQNIISKIQELDKNIFIFLHKLGKPQYDNIWVFVTNKYHWIPLYIIIFYLIIKKQKYFKIDKVIYTILFFALLITITDQTSNIFKNTFERLRPCSEEGLVRIINKIGCNGYSFIS